MSIIQFPKSAIVRKTLKYEYEYDREKQDALITIQTSNPTVSLNLNAIFSYAEDLLRYKDVEALEAIHSILLKIKKSCAKCAYAKRNCTKAHVATSDTCHKANYINTGGLVLLTGETNHE